jgi:formamidopyrimidine-DNA glycosylase
VPELPDVEGFRRSFEHHATGRTVRAVRSVDAILLRGTSAQAIGRALHGRTFQRPGRHGKVLLCPAHGPVLALHFGMTGSLEWDGQPHAHDRLVLELDRGVVAFRNMRRMGGIWLARDAGEVGRITGRLGPDWLDVSRRELDDVLDRRAALKAVLMDQTAAAGLGNLTADESLWRARIDPRRTARSLGRDERSALYRGIRRVLRDSLPLGRVPPRPTWLTGVRDDRAGRCPRCDERLRRATVGGRTTVYCPKEQR